jgi:uncharacterized membrane protein YeaQ/YmgE (transglycosylase-associated protein family)
MLLILVLVFLALFVVLPLVGLALWALVTTAIVGLVMGGLGRLLIPGSQPIGLLATLLLGLVGAITGSFIAHLIGVGHLLTLLLEIGASAVLVAAYSATGRSRRLSANSR